MAEDDQEQRTEDASDKKREETLEKGRTAQSKEIGSTAVLLVALAVLNATGGYMREHIADMMRHSFTISASYQLDVISMRPLMLYYMKELAVILWPLMAGVAAAGVAAAILQNGGLIFTLEPLMPKLDKLNPLNGFGRFFSPSAVAELLKSLGKIAIVGYICYLVLRNEIETIPLLSDQSVEQIILFVSHVSVKLMFYVLLLMLALAAADYGFQKYTYEQSIKMTKQEVKDERKNTEGDPITKQRIRTAQYAMARRRMMQEVPKAEVIITNPTHLAIALAYDRGKMAAPAVVAKGAGHIAEKIKEIARQHNIPIVEDKPLARLLFKSMDIGKAIPEELYRTIAEILAYVYKLKGKHK
ncbi:MAG: flagellar biosynthesis protein FlhB [Nitrospinae bacterium]|nr:flagellar biosynthesis protein FlhB [Nitrospinota bacterium]